MRGGGCQRAGLQSSAEILARVLRRHGLVSTISERGAHALERPQGGSLDVHETSDRWAPREAGLHDRFRELARTGRDHRVEGIRGLVADNALNRIVERFAAMAETRAKQDEIGGG